MATDSPQQLAELAGTLYQFETSIQHQTGETFLIRQGRGAMVRIAPPPAVTHDPQAIAVGRQGVAKDRSRRVPATHEVPALPLLRT